MLLTSIDTHYNIKPTYFLQLTLKLSEVIRMLMSQFYISETTGINSQ